MPLFVTAAMVLPAPVRCQSDTAPTVAERLTRIASLNAALVGRYEYHDTELMGTVELCADGSFDYHFRYIGRPVEGEKPLDLHLVGVWRVGPGGHITLTDAPSASEFVQSSASTDRSVAAAITITVAGPYADRRGEFGLLIDGGANGFVELDSGGWSLPLTAKTRPGVLEIVLGDGRLLFKVRLAPGGPNRFGFTYTPGPAPAFSLSAMTEKGQPDVIGVEFGQAGVRMTRVWGQGPRSR